MTLFDFRLLIETETIWVLRYGSELYRSFKITEPLRFIVSWLRLSYFVRVFHHFPKYYKIFGHFLYKNDVFILSFTFSNTPFYQFHNNISKSFWKFYLGKNKKDRKRIIFTFLIRFVISLLNNELGTQRHNRVIFFEFKSSINFITLIVNYLMILYILGIKIETIIKLTFSHISSHLLWFKKDKFTFYLGISIISQPTCSRLFRNHLR